MEEKSVLAKLPIFSSLDDKELDALAEAANKEECSNGTVIIEEGSSGKALYIIIKGAAEVVKRENEVESIIVELKEGEHFGEMSLIEDAQTSATIRATEDMEYISIARDDFLKVLEEDVNIAAKVYKAFTVTLSRRLRHADNEIVTWKPSFGI